MDDGRSITDIQPHAAGNFGPLVKVRKFVTHVEEILHDFGPTADRPWVKGFIAAVCANPMPAGTRKT